jgi:hypothetical protein
MTDWQDGPVRVLVGEVHWRLRSLPVTGVDALEASSLDHAPQRYAPCDLSTGAGDQRPELGRIESRAPWDV